MVMNLWNSVETYCGHHEVPVKMDIAQKGKLMFYACTDPKCKCSISLKDFEKMLDYLSDLMYNAELKNEVLYLDGYSWKQKMFAFKILEHKEKIRIQIISKENR